MKRRFGPWCCATEPETTVRQSFGQNTVATRCCSQQTQVLKLSRMPIRLTTCPAFAGCKFRTTEAGRNVNEALINYFKPQTAFVSADGSTKKHPRRAVVNAFKAAGAKVFQAHTTILPRTEDTNTSAWEQCRKDRVWVAAIPLYEADKNQ